MIILKHFLKGGTTNFPCQAKQRFSYLLNMKDALLSKRGVRLLAVDLNLVPSSDSQDVYGLSPSEVARSVNKTDQVVHSDNL